MTRLLLLDRGEELTPSTARALVSAGAPLRLKLLRPARPLAAGQVVRVAPPAGAPAWARDLVLFADGERLGLGVRRSQAVRSGADVLGRIVALERGQWVFSLERGLLARVPLAWLSRTADALEVLHRLRHPLTPSLYVGSPDACLASVREKYNRETEARGYVALSLTGLEPLERAIVARHVQPGGRILDSGCGAGREALGFARMGYRVVGIDIAPRMVEAACARAAQEGVEIAFRVQSVTDLDEPPCSFDAAFWAGSYHHVPGRALRVETLRRIGRALTPGGVLILMVSYRTRRGLLSRSRLVDLLRRTGRRVGRGFVSETGDGYIREVSEASDPREVCFFHTFARPREIQAEVASAGFTASEFAPGWWLCRR